MRKLPAFLVAIALFSPVAFAKTTIGLSVSTLNNPFFVALRDGATAAANKAGADLIVLDAQNRADKQIGDIEDLITRKVSVILINPTDSDAVVGAIQKANAAKIPVITVDRSANGGMIAYHIASDNIAGGKMAGEYIKKMLGGKGNLVELVGVPGTSAARDRGAGFNSVVKATPGFKIVASQPADFDRAKGLTVMENILQAQPDIAAVFAHNDEMALGAVQAIKGSNRKIMVVGFDATDDALAAVKAGTMAATVQQQPEEIGRLGVVRALYIVRTGKVPAKTINVPVPLRLVTK